MERWLRKPAGMEQGIDPVQEMILWRVNFQTKFVKNRAFAPAAVAPSLVQILPNDLYRKFSHASGSVRGVHVRRVLVEAAWCYRFQARKTAHLQRRAEKAGEAVQALAWKAQKRLCRRYRHLAARGKLKVEVCTAIVRELAGFIWAIACEEMGRPVMAR